MQASELPTKAELAHIGARLEQASGDERSEVVDELLEAQLLLEEALDAGDESVAALASRATYMLTLLRPEELPDERTHADLLGQSLEQGRDVLSDRQLSGGAYDLAVELVEAGRRRRAAEVVDEYVAHFTERRHALPWLLEVRADLERRRGEYDVALATLRAAREHAGAEPERVDQPALLQVYLDIGEAGVLMEVGLLQEARAVWRRAVAREGAGDDPAAAIALTEMDSALSLAAGDYGAVLRHAQSAAGLGSGRIELDESIARAEELLAAQRGGRGGTSADGVRGELVSLLEGSSLRPHDRLDALRTLAELAFFEGDLAGVREHLAGVRAAVTGDSGYLRERRYLAEFEARLGLAESAPPEVLAGLRDELDGAWARMLAAWSRVPPTPGGVAFLHYAERRAALSTRIRVELAIDPARGAERAFELLLEAERRGSLAHTLSAAGERHATLGDVRSSLVADGRGVLVYLPTSEVSLALTLDPSGARVHELGPMESWLNVQRLLATRVKDDRSAPAEIAELAAELGRSLLPPSLDATLCGWRELTVVGLESLEWGPLELLPLAGRGGSLVGHELAIGYVPSMTVGVRLAERARARSEPAPDQGPLAVLVAAIAARPMPGGVESFEALPWDDGISRRLTGAWPPERVQLVTEDSRSLASIEGAASSGARMLEIFCHGLEDRTRALPVGLGVGADPDGLDWDAIAALQAPPLVTLAVCRAGKGHVTVGDEGATSLGGAFLLAGTDVVLLSAEDLSFLATVALLQEVHLHLSRGASAARALMLARRELASSTEWSHPFHHARVVAFGLPHAQLAGLPPMPLDPTDEADPPGTSPWLIGAALVISLAILAAGLWTRVRGRRRGRAASRP